MRAKANEKAIQNMWENVIPIFVLYLIDHFRCKEKGVTNFLNWINEQEEWINEDPVGNLKKIRQEVEDRANVHIIYDGL